MPDKNLFTGGWVLAFSLALAGCNSGSDTPQTGGNDDGQQTDILLEPGANEALLYYKRSDENYTGWGLHLWNDAAAGCDGLAEGVPTDWASPRLPDGVSDTYGAWYRIPMREAGNCLNFIMHKGDEKDIGGVDHRWHFDDLGNRIFTLSGWMPTLWCSRVRPVLTGSNCDTTPMPALPWMTPIKHWPADRS